MDFQRHQWMPRGEVEHGIDSHGHQWTSNAGGGIRTLNPSRGLVFETSAYTVPPRRLVSSMIPHQVQEVNMRLR